MRKDSYIVAFGYFFIHALVEVICFDVLYTRFFHNGIIWIIALLFDFFAFVPQGLIGDYYNEHPNMDLGLVGAILMSVGIICVEVNGVIGLILLGLGNSFVHEAGAYGTIISGHGALAGSGYFVAGGSFGVVLGQFVGSWFHTGLLFHLALMALMIVLILYTNRYWRDEKKENIQFHLVKEDVSFQQIVLVAFFVVVARSFIGYCIPISWKKSVWQAFLLFYVMGFGKAMGGLLADRFGAKKVAVTSSLLCIPFLVFGKDYMIISIIGVFMFSLTMAITFGMFLSVIKDNIGLAFGFTTLGLFIGTLPVFIFGSFSSLVNVIIVVVLSLFSAYGLAKTLK